MLVSGDLYHMPKKKGSVGISHISKANIFHLHTHLSRGSQIPFVIFKIVGIVRILSQL